jgi:transportin-3
MNCCFALQLIDTLSYFAPLIGQSIVQWTQQTLGLIPSSALSDNEKDAFLQAVAHVASSSNDHREQLTTAVDELSDVCRRNKKVLSVVQDALQPLQLNYPSG